MANITVTLLEDFAGKFAAKCLAYFARKTEIPKSLPADGGNAETVSGHTIGSDVPENAQFTDTTYSDMVGAGDGKAGTAGLVPAPAKGMQNAYLRGDGTWQEIQEATVEEIDAIIAGVFEEGEGESV